MNQRFNFLLFFLFLCIIVERSFAQTAPELSLISVSRNKFISAKGDTMVFRGVNISDPAKLSMNKHWNKEYFQEAKNWGANIIRFPVHPTTWRNQGKVKYLKLLDDGVQWAKELGMYVILDWHSIGNLKSGLYQSDMYETTLKETFEFWRTMAIHFKDNTTVAFFELYNEPTVYNGQLGICSWQEWKAINEEMITIIRANGAKAIPLVAGFNWAYDLTEAGKDPIQAEGIAYVSHPYPQKRAKPWEEKWTADWGFIKDKYPLILTEIGFCGAEDKGAHVPVTSDESYGDAITKYCAERGISYTIWVFDPDWAPMLFSDWKFTPTRQGRYFKAALQKKQ